MGAPRVNMKHEAIGSLVAALCITGCASDHRSSATSGTPAAPKPSSVAVGGTTGAHAMSTTTGAGGAPNGAMTTPASGGMMDASAGSAAPPPTAAQAPATPTGTSGTGGAAGAGSPGTPSTFAADDPKVPMITGDCPSFDQSGAITFMGLAGIDVEIGPKPPMPTAPMVLYWHGTGSTSGEYAMLAPDVYQGVIAEGGVLISFEGTTGGDLLSGTAIFGAGDLKLADQLYACAVRDHDVDPRRVFVTGCSAGGMFAAAMATERSSYIAAVATNSGGWVMQPQFEDDHTPKLMAIHGPPGQDLPIIDFSQTSANAIKGFEERGGFVIDCNDANFSHCRGDLAPNIWKFFKDHPYGVDPEPWATGLPAGFNAACKVQ